MNTLSAAAARRIRLIGLDVDGVLTDNGVFIGPVAGARVELKRFDIQDGLGLGLLVSTVSQNQRQAQQLTMMIVLLGVILGGFIFPRYTMPRPIQLAGFLFPLTYFIPIARGIITKGVGLPFLQEQLVALVIYIVIILFIAVRSFRQELD